MAFGLPGGHDFCSFSIEEELVCGVRSYSENFVLRNENIFTFQLTANIGFLEGGAFKSLKITLGGYR